MRDTYFLASFQSLLFCEERNAGAVFGDSGNDPVAGDLKQGKRKHRIMRLVGGNHIADEKRRKKCAYTS